MKDVYSVEPKPRKKQQVGISNLKDYIIPQSVVNSVLHDRQQCLVEKQGATKFLPTNVVVQGHSIVRLDSKTPTTRTYIPR